MNVFLAVLQGVIGGIILFFLVGWLIVDRFFKHVRIYEKVIYSIAISICVCILISLILAYTGIFGLISFLIAYFIIVIAFLGLKYYKKIIHH